MKHTIPAAWTMALLADVVESAQDGDTILVHNVAMQERAEWAHQKMCPDKNLVFEIQAPLSDTVMIEDPKEEGPFWAHGTKETNPHWPYEGPAQGWIHA